MTRIQPRPALFGYLRAALPVALAILLLPGLAGCGKSGIRLRPLYDVGEQSVVGDKTAARIEKAGLELTIRQERVSLLDDETTIAIEIDVFNAEGPPVVIPLENAILIDDGQARHPATEPASIIRILQPTHLPDAAPPGPQTDTDSDFQSDAYDPPAVAPDEDPERQLEVASLIARLWQEPVVESGYRRTGLLLFECRLEKRQVIRLHFAAWRVQPGETVGPPTPIGQPIPFEFTFYTK